MPVDPMSSMGPAGPDVPGPEVGSTEVGGPEVPGPEVSSPEVGGLPTTGALDRDPDCDPEGWDPERWDREHWDREGWDREGWESSAGDPSRGNPRSVKDDWDPDAGALPAGAVFAQGRWGDELAPDPVLATLADLTWREGLEQLDDDQLTGVLQAAARLASWSAALKLAATSRLAARREAAGQQTGDWRPFDHVDDEVAVALTLTRRSAGRLLDLALSLDRLPLTRAALAAGLIDERRAEVIAEELTGLDDAHAAAVEKLIIGKAPRLTSGQLRALVRRAVISADPAAARRRKEQALKDARVETFTENAGTAGLSGRDLPPTDVLAADKHLTALAQAMKAAGISGTMDVLRAHAYLHLLSGQPANTLIPTATPGGTGLGGTSPGTDPAGPPPAPADPDAGSFPPPPGTSPGLRGTVNLTMPLSAWLGWTQSPGDVPGFGPLDAADSRTLAGMLSHNPANRWCVTLTDRAGHPVAHACAPHCPRTRPGPHRPATQDGPTTQVSPGTRAGSGDGPPGSVTSRDGPPATGPPDWLRGLTFTTLQTRDCTHPRESRGYQPSRTLRHLIQIRNPACTAPGCRHAATRCDLDHVTPYHHGGRTCECNLGPACRRDHQCKQTPGWTLTTPAPGTLTWTTPGNRSYTTTPAQYPD